MSLMWLDSKYLSFLSFRLRNFKKKGTHSWNFSCQYCGDSKTNKTKARGYVFPAKGKLRFYCHNCNVPGVDIPALLKHLDQSLFDEYLKEKLMASPNVIKQTEAQEFAEMMKPPKFVQGRSPLRVLKKVSSLDQSHAAKILVDTRQIPTNYHYKLFYCSKFKRWVNEYCVPDKFDEESLTRDEPRLIIPFLDKDSNMFGFQGRSFQRDAAVRYITIIMDHSKPKLFGLDTVDDKKHIYVVEGPIDSMFLPNCIASAGSDLITNLDIVSEEKKQFTIIFDNEPRNKEIVKKMDKAIEQGYTVCFWPESVKQKDINDMILSGLSSEKVVAIINGNRYNGLEAKLKLHDWKKV